MPFLQFPCDPNRQLRDGRCAPTLVGTPCPPGVRRISRDGHLGASSVTPCASSSSPGSPTATYAIAPPAVVLLGRAVSRDDTSTRKSRRLRNLLTWDPGRRLRDS